MNEDLHTCINIKSSPRIHTTYTFIVSYTNTKSSFLYPIATLISYSFTCTRVQYMHHSCQKWTILTTTLRVWIRSNEFPHVCICDLDCNCEWTGKFSVYIYKDTVYLCLIRFCARDLLYKHTSPGIIIDIRIKCVYTIKKKAGFGTRFWVLLL